MWCHLPSSAGLVAQGTVDEGPLFISAKVGWGLTAFCVSVGRFPKLPCRGSRTPEVRLDSSHSYFSFPLRNPGLNLLQEEIGTEDGW